MSKNIEQMKSNLVNLVKLHPISLLYIMRKTFWALTPFVSSIILLRWMPYFPLSSHQPMMQVAHTSVLTISIILGMSLLASMTYYYIKRRTYYYGIEEGQLVIARGIILRERGYFQLSRITEVYLDRSFIDVLFGLYTLHISTPTAVSDKFARIDGLNEETALSLQQHLSLILEENYGSEVKDTRFSVRRIVPTGERSGQQYAFVANAA